ncbi:hypothetical protein BDV12DRAFT_207094 [Aspergillus spectabilis]
MSQPVFHRPETPIFQSTALQELHPNVLSEYADPPSDSSASTSECECCASPPLPDLATLAEAISDRGRNTPGLSSTLEGQFLDSVSLLPAAESAAQAAAIVPHDRQANGHWLLVTLLCHRVFDACGDQAETRNFGVFYHGTFGPGDVSNLAETTVTRDGALVAIATAFYDQAHSHTVDNTQVRDANQRRAC